MRNIETEGNIIHGYKCFIRDESCDCISKITFMNNHLSYISNN